MVNSEAQFPQAPLPPSQADTDELVQRVTDQISSDIFNANDTRLLQQLVECLADSRGMTRLQIVEIFGEIGEDATPILLNSLLYHVNPVVRRSSAKALAVITDHTAVPSLIQALLTDVDTVVRASSAGALAKMGEAAVPALLEILESSEYSASAKGHAAWAIAFIGTKARPYLSQAFGSDSEDVRAAIVGAIAKVTEENSDEDSCDVLIKALEDKASIVRCEAAIALGNLDHQPAQPKLIELLNHTDWETRKSAALALMKLGDQTALQPLRDRLKQESEGIVQNVIELAISQLEKRQTQNNP